MFTVNIIMLLAFSNLHTVQVNILGMFMNVSAVYHVYVILCCRVIMKYIHAILNLNTH